jgi:hypothetical protein
VKEPIVVDSTCLIGLERIGRLDLLSELFAPVVIPPEVDREFGVSLDWLKIQSPANDALVRSLKLVLDRGEAEVIALGYGENWRVVLDDRQARAVEADGTKRHRDSRCAGSCKATINDSGSRAIIRSTGGAQLLSQPRPKRRGVAIG